MSGHLENLSPSQQRDLEEFRRILSDVLKPKHDDRLLLQFLRARRFDLKKAEEMFRKHLQFREEYDDEYLLSEYQPPELLVKYFLPPLMGYDHDGCPVRIINAGPADIKGIVSCFRRPEIRRCVTYFLDKDKEEMKKRNEETGKYVETRTFIFDLNGLSLRQIYHKDVYELVISFLKLYEGNYPENLKVAYVINTPSFFAWMFSMIKSLLSEDTVKKLKIYGHSGWKEDLLQAMDPDILPVIYGGTKTDPDGDPRCRTMIPPGGPIPTKYYLKNTQKLNPEDENVQGVVVGRRSKHIAPIKVDLPGSTICWEVECQNCDINLYLLHTDGPAAEVVIEPTRVNNNLGLEKGFFMAEKTGNYGVVFDNSYSLLRSKTILYKCYIATSTAREYEPLQFTKNC